MTDLLRNVGLSRYELNARLKPALFALLPMFIVAVFWYPGAWSIAASALAAASSCGVLFALAQLARRRGRAAERRLNGEVGRSLTAKLLTHSDNTILVQTKVRYHTYLRAHGRSLSNVEEERAEPEVAFDRARSAVDWLLEHTRTARGGALLLDENISYGFQRNLFGLKPFGVGLSAIAVAAHMFFLTSTVPEREQLWFGIAVCILLLFLLACWLYLVTKRAVIEASFAYAERLLASCEAAPTPGHSAKKSSSGGAGNPSHATAAKEMAARKKEGSKS